MVRSPRYLLNNEMLAIRDKGIRRDSIELFNRKISLLISKLNNELRKKLVRCYVWSIALYHSKTCTLRKLEQKYLESFKM